VNRVAICTDSSSLLPETSAASLGVTVVPVAMTLDGRPYDERTSSIEWFYERLRAGAVVTTAYPSSADFAEAYAQAASRGAQTIVSIHLDARASSTVSAAETAARYAPIPVKVVDTGTVNYGVALCVRAAAESAAAGGLSADAALAARRLGARLQNAFVALRSPGGRVPTRRGWMLFRFKDGAASALFDCASVEEAIERIASLLLVTEGPFSAAVGYAGRATETAAGQLAHRLLGTEHVLDVERYRIGAPVGAHTGPDSFGAFWWPTQEGEASLAPTPR
jgi:fatty acid-binding protein DegV